MMLLGILSLVSFWFGVFYWGRAIGALVVGSDYVTDYVKKGWGIYLIGLAFLFANLALGTQAGLPATSQEWGAMGLFLMAYHGSCVGGGYLFERSRGKVGG